MAGAHEEITDDQVDVLEQEVLGLLATIMEAQPLRHMAEAMQLQLVGVQGRKALYRLVANRINSDDFQNLQLNERFESLGRAMITMKAHLDELNAQHNARENERDAGRDVQDGGVVAEVKKEEEKEEDEDSEDDEDKGKVKEQLKEVLAKAKVEPVVHRLKELKLKGRIKNPEEKKKLSMTSLLFQVKSALTRGYPEVDVVDGIINIIDEDVPVREVFEMMEMEDLTLEFVLSTLKDLYTDLDSTSVYHELCNAMQDKGELLSSFLWRLRLLRDKVLKISKKEGAEYTKELLQTQFQRSFFSGISNEAVRVQLRYLSKSKHVSDARLIKDVNEIMLAEKAHEEKKNLGKKKTSVNVLSSSSEGTDEEAKMKTKKTTDMVMAQLNKLSTQIASMGNMKSELDQLRTGMKQEMNQLRSDMQGACNMFPMQQQESQTNNGYSREQPISGYGLETSVDAIGGYAFGMGQRGRGRGGRSFRGGYRGGFGGGYRGGFGGQYDNSWTQMAPGSNRPHLVGKFPQFSAFACDQCKRDNAYICNHCFLCGSVEHERRNCHLLIEKNEEKVSQNGEKKNE